MIVVVEIASRTGTRACKEYDAPSYNAAIEVVKREVRAYPRFASQTSGSRGIERFSEKQPTSGDLGLARKLTRADGGRSARPTKSPRPVLR